VAERLQVIDDFDGQFADDVSKLSKLKKKVVSSYAAVDATDAIVVGLNYFIFRHRVYLIYCKFC